VAAKGRTNLAGAGCLVSLLQDAQFILCGERASARPVGNFRIGCRGCRHDRRPSAAFCADTHGSLGSDGQIRHDHETFSYVARSLNFTGWFVSSSLAQRGMARTQPSTIASLGHLPPGTSKWNRIEHRLFAFIAQN
jgi:Rhodopirellula transposase DDE domain